MSIFCDAIWNKSYVTAEECLKTWTGLRNNYRKALKSRAYKSGDAAKKKRPIKFEKELDFLRKFFQDRPQHSNLDSSSEDTQYSEHTQHFENTQHPETSLPTPEVQSPVSQMSTSSRASDPRPAQHVHQQSHLSSSKAQRTETTADILKKYLENQNKDQHPVEIFFQAMAATVKSLSPKLQAEVKRDVFHIVSEAEIKHSESMELATIVQQNRPSTSSSGFHISNESLGLHSSQQYTPISATRTHNLQIGQHYSENSGTKPTPYIPTPISRCYNNDTFENNSEAEFPNYGSNN